MNEVNEKFNNFREAIKDGSNDEIEEKLNIYTTSRKKLTFQILNDEHNRWSETIEKKDSKHLWSMIDWNGKLHNTKPVQPSIHDMKNHFEVLYTIEDPSEAERI